MKYLIYIIGGLAILTFAAIAINGAASSVGKFLSEIPWYVEAILSIAIIMLVVKMVEKE